MRSEEWKPGYLIEGRSPGFISKATSPEEFNQGKIDNIARGLRLWGNVPSMDTLNLSENEKNSTKDLCLAFVASGDLRNVMHTINALPHDYSGKLTVVINDVEDPVIYRNLILLLILGTISDRVLAADIALHFWYSLFLPIEYRTQIGMVMLSYLDPEHHQASSFPLGPTSTLSALVSSGGKQHLEHFLSSSMSLDDTQAEYSRVRNLPSDQDFRDRIYSGLRPSHRVAFQEYRRFGLVLPFGAANSHFNSPNQSLFSLRGTWLQTNFVDPLWGYNLDVVVEAGKAHGAQPEDIYGCLFFYLSQQLRKFTDRIHKFHISFKLFPFNAISLSEAIVEDSLAMFGVPSSIRFDRVAVSNVIDDNYLGIDKVLTLWGPLLAPTPHATLIGYFLNWAPLCQPNGHASGASKAVQEKLIKQVVERHKSKSSIGALLSVVHQSSSEMQILYDNSRPFLEFLEKKGLGRILDRNKLSRKKCHTIVPQRIGAPLGGTDGALPHFSNDESYYYATKLHSSTWSERFIEISLL